MRNAIAGRSLPPIIGGHWRSVQQAEFIGCSQSGKSFTRAGENRCVALMERNGPPPGYQRENPGRGTDAALERSAQPKLQPPAPKGRLVSEFRRRTGPELVCEVHSLSQLVVNWSSYISGLLKTKAPSHSALFERD